MEATAESQVCHGPAAMDGNTDGAQQQSPRLEPAATDNVTECSEKPTSVSSSLAAPAAMTEEILAEKTVEPLVTDDVLEHPLPECLSPLPSPGVGGGDATSDRPEDDAGKDEALGAGTHTPLSLSPSTTLLKTPTMSDSAKVAAKAETVAEHQTLQVTEERSPPTSQTSSAPSSRDLPDIYHAPRPRRRPSALDYLVSVSPPATPRAAHDASYRGAQAGLHHMSAFSDLIAPSASNSHLVGASQERGVDARPRMGWATNCSAPGEVLSPPGYQRSEAFCNLARSPAMARSHAPMADSALSPVAPSMLQAGYGAEKPPMSGYQLLAAKLVGGLGGPPVTPMYRRFEALNHRLLLYMQADLVELENELHSLDTKDTMDRGYGIIPASRRHERWANHSLAQQRTEILGQIGYKLSQYNKVMASFRKTQDMAAPALHEIHEYRSYLAASRLVADEETSFLDAADDLVSLAAEEPPPADASVADASVAGHSVFAPAGRPAPDGAAVPAASLKGPESEAGSRVPARHHHHHHHGHHQPQQQQQQHRHGAPARDGDWLAASLAQLALAMFVAVFVPVATFAVIPGFAGRVTVVALVGCAVAVALAQSGLVRLLDRGALDWAACVAAYGATMAVVAAVLA